MEGAVGAASLVCPHLRFARRSQSLQKTLAFVPSSNIEAWKYNLSEILLFSSSFTDVGFQIRYLRVFEMQWAHDAQRVRIRLIRIARSCALS